jgi:hypothetical protein
MTLQPYELKLAAKLLEMASEKFSNHGCNEFDLIAEAGLTIEEATAINRACFQRTGDADGYGGNLDVSQAVFGDSVVMEYLAQRLAEEATS